MDFDKMNGLIPAIIQDADTAKVLMLGFMNKVVAVGAAVQGARFS